MLIYAWLAIKEVMTWLYRQQTYFLSFFICLIVYQEKEESQKEKKKTKKKNLYKLKFKRCSTLDLILEF